MLLKLDLNSNLAVTPSYFNPALNNSALGKKEECRIYYTFIFTFISQEMYWFLNFSSLVVVDKITDTVRYFGQASLFKN